MSNNDLPTMANRNILITGASSGIGAALARAYAAAGSHLTLWGRNRERLSEVGDQCRDRGASVEIECFDIADCDRLASSLEALDARTPVDIAIFNAGLGGTVPRDQIAQSSRSTREMGLVNFVSPLLGANLLAERMAARRRGHIVFVGSIAASFPLPMAPAYAATKAGLALFSEALRLRLKGAGVTVTLVSPGFVDTPMSRSLQEPRPFLVSADKAASIIRARLERRARRIVVPWQFAIIRGIAAWLPRALIRAVLIRT
jgi:short-subunit dehydrogenase